MAVTEGVTQGLKSRDVTWQFEDSQYPQDPKYLRNFRIVKPNIYFYTELYYNLVSWIVILNFLTLRLMEQILQKLQPGMSEGRLNGAMDNLSR